MKTLADHRVAIDAIDDRIVDLIAARFQIVKAVGDLKALEKIEVVQSARAEQVKDRVAAMAEARGVSGQLLRDIYTLMIDHAHIVEQR